jgi:hypothetical protein
VVHQVQDARHTHFPQMHAPKAREGTETYLRPAFFVCNHIVFTH